MRDLGLAPDAAGPTFTLAEIELMCEPAALVVRDAYAHGSSAVFLISPALAALGAFAILFVKETPLGTTVDDDENPMHVSAELDAADTVARHRRMDGPRRHRGRKHRASS